MRSRHVVAVALSLLALMVPGSTAPQSVGYSKRTAAGVAANVITVNMNDPKVKVSVVLCQGFPGTDEAFASLVKRSGGVAAVAGTYFDKYTRIPIGDIVVDGRLRHEGRMATAMAITASNQVSFGRVVWGHSADWTGYETVLAAGPTLLKGGQVDLKPQEERFRDPHVLGAGVRTAVGMTPENRMLLVTIGKGVTLQKLAEVMRALGCVEAMALDGGASMAMHYRGKTITNAGRRLTNLLVIQEGAQHVADLGEPLYKPEGNGGQPRRVAQRAVLEVPEYPGAQADTKSLWDDGPSLFTTADSLDKVVAFYRKELGERGNAQVIPAGDERVALIRITSGIGAGGLVQVVELAGRTRIVLSADGFAVPHQFFR